jgi:hypothetical protein
MCLETPYAYLNALKICPIEIATMTQNPLFNLKRRSMLKACGRYSAALAAILGGAALFRRNTKGEKIPENACLDPEGRTGCTACKLLDTCGLPRGLSFKYTRKDNANG